MNAMGPWWRRRRGDSHFETTATDVLSMYERVTGQKLDLTIDPEVDPDES